VKGGLIEVNAPRLSDRYFLKQMPNQIRRFDMSYKTIAAYLARPDNVTDVMNAALPLAEKFGAHLTGIHVSSGVPVIGTIGAQVPPEIIEQYVQHMHEDAEAIEAAFSKAVKGAQVQSEWRQPELKVVGTDILHMISTQTRCADIVVMGQSDTEQRVGELTADIIIDAGRPVIIVPKNCAAPSLTGKIVIAWDGSREATRAAFDSLPLLKEAQSVRVVTIAKEDGKNPVTSGCGDLTLALARHGVKAEAVALESNAAAGETLTKYVSENDCDLIVMGCYGHSRLRERLFGGATRHFLQEMIVPVLMSH
jgi:nucleotide-binding universal stress UspA family protein